MRLFYINLIQVLRHLRRHWVQVALSVAGLVVGLVCFTLSVSDLWYVTHYDDFRRDYGELYQLQRNSIINPYAKYDDQLSVGCVDDLRQRLTPGLSMTVTESAPGAYLSVADTEYRGNERVQMGLNVDSAFIGLLDVKVLKGDPIDLWRLENRIVLTDTEARRLFGHTDVVGQTLYLSTVFGRRTVSRMTVAAVVREERHTTLEFKYLLPFNPDPAYWYVTMVNIYVRAPKRAELDRILAQANEHYNRDRDHGQRFLRSMPLRQVYLVGGGAGLWTVAFYPMCFALLSALLLLSALFNYTALLTAMCMGQLRGYGLRISLGGGFADNARRLLMEVGVVALTVCLLAAVGVEWLSSFYEVRLTLSRLYGYYSWYAAGLVGAMLLFSLYPLARMYRLYRSSLAPGVHRNVLQRPMLVLQAAVSMLLLFLVVNGYRQFRFMTHDGLGFNADRVLMMNSNKTPSAEVRDVIYSNTFAERLRTASPAITDARCYSHRIFQNSMIVTQPSNLLRQDGDPDTQIFFYYIPEGAPEMFELDVRGWDGEPMTFRYRPGEMLASTSAIQQLELTADDCEVTYNGQVYRVVGTLDYCAYSFKRPAYPTLYFGDDPYDKYARELCVKYVPGRRAEAVEAICREVERMNVERGEVEIEDYADKIAQCYADARHYLMLFSLLAVLSLCVTLSGLLAMVSYELRRSRRSIAIRRVFGAGFGHLFRRYLALYLTAVAVGVVVVLPLGYLMMLWWLQSYTGQITLGVWPALVSATLLLAFTATVVWACLRRTWRECPAQVLQGE